MSGGEQKSAGARRRDARKGTQRERLVAAMVQVAASEGFGAATIAAVIDRAGVSRPTFYDYFEDKEACLLAALDEAQERLLAQVRRALSVDQAANPLQVAIVSVVDFARAQPAMARLLMGEASAGGPPTLDLRDRGLEEIAAEVDRGYPRVPTAASAPDASTWMLIGGLYRLLARTLRRGDAIPGELATELRVWTASYERPLSAHRWRTLEPVRLTPAHQPGPPLLKPIPTLGRGQRLSSEDPAGRRERILFAAAEIAKERGYAGATITAIVKRAGVDHRAFHKEFASEQEAIAELHELFFQRLMTVSVGAFFAQSTWPERVWQAGLAFTSAVEENPLLAHVAFVEGPAAGPAAVRRFEDLVSAFTIFLEQGYEAPKQRAYPSNAGLEAIAWATHELAYRQSRGSAEGRMVGLLPHVTFLILAPFLGPAEADKFIDAKLG